MSLFRRDVDNSRIKFHCVELSGSDQVEIKRLIKENGGVCHQDNHFGIRFIQRSKYKENLRSHARYYDIDFIRCCVEKSKILNLIDFRLGPEFKSERCVTSCFLYGECLFKSACDKIVLDTEPNGWRNLLPIDESQSVVRNPYARTLKSTAIVRNPYARTLKSTAINNKPIIKISTDNNNIKKTPLETPLDFFHVMLDYDMDCSTVVDIVDDSENEGDTKNICSSEVNTDNHEKETDPLENATPNNSISVGLEDENVSSGAYLTAREETTDNSQINTMEEQITEISEIKIKEENSSPLWILSKSIRADKTDLTTKTHSATKDRFVLLPQDAPKVCTPKNKDSHQFLKQQIHFETIRVIPKSQNNDWNRPGPSGILTKKKTPLDANTNNRSKKYNADTNIKQERSNDNIRNENEQKRKKKLGNRRFQDDDDDCLLDDDTTDIENIKKNSSINDTENQPPRDILTKSGKKYPRSRDHWTNKTRTSIESQSEDETNSVKTIKPNKRRRKNSSSSSAESEDERPNSKMKNVSKDRHGNEIAPESVDKVISIDDDSGEEYIWNLPLQQTNNHKPGKPYWRSQLDVRPNRMPVTHTNYTDTERLAIVNYLLSLKNIVKARPKGLSLWRGMLNKGLLQHRTVQSVHNHFMKKILPNIEHYYKLMSEDQIEQFKELQGRKNP